MTTTHPAARAPAPTVVTRSRWLPRDERSLFLLGTALVALHVLDDTLLQPPAGTTAADHLASALVPTVLLAAAAWGFGRVRAGWRAVLALSVGVFGIGIGVIEAGYYTAAVGPSGDDFTGLLAIPAGVLLVGLGLWTLWQSRRRTGRLGAASSGARLTSWWRPWRRTSSRSRCCSPMPSRTSSVPGAGGRAGRRTRERQLHDLGRAAPARLVHPVAQRRRGRRLPRAARHPGGRADARPARLRRTAVRPTRRGSQRGWREHARLGRRQGHHRRGRLAEAAAGRRPATASAASASRSAAS